MRVISILSVCALAAISNVHAYSKYAKLIPNGNGVKGVTAVGHTDPDSGGDLNAFGKAFKAAGNSWTEALCKADADGDGQTNGEELGDPCCVWKSGGTPAVAAGATDPGVATSKLDDAALTAARALCKTAEAPAASSAAPAAGTVKPNDGASNATPALTPGATSAAPAAAGATPAAAPAAPAAAPAAGTPAAAAPAASTGSDEYDWVALDSLNSSSAAGSSKTATTAPSAAKSSNSTSANTSSAATTAYTMTASSSGFAAVVATVVSALALAL